MKTRAECIAAAAKEFETLLKDCGWIDSYGLTAAKIKTVKAPMFARNVVSQALSAKTAYMVYTVTDDIKTGGYSDNASSTGKIYIDFTITLQDPFYFENENDTKRNYLIDIELEGEKRGWKVNFQNDITIPALEVAAAAQYQKNYTAVKRFNNLER